MLDWCMRIASWNVSCYKLSKSASFEFDYEDKENPNYFADIINKVNPDVICLQENYSNKETSFSEKIIKGTNLKYYLDAPGTRSYFNKKYYDTNTILSKYDFEEKENVLSINPKWQHTFSFGYTGATYDEWFQIAKIKGLTMANVHFLPEKTFEKDYSKGIGNEYFEENLDLLKKYPFSLFIGDFNTVSLNKMLKKFAKEKNLVNIFKDVGTRPIPSGDVVIEDAIFCNRNLKIIKKGLVKTRNDHYLIWADIDT